MRDIAEGRLAICPEISEALAVDRVQEEKMGLHGLSPREFEIFRMILDAKSTDEIASAFNLSRKTVDRLTQARIAPVLDLCSPEPLRMGSGSGTEVIPKLAPEFNRFLRLAIRHPNGSGAGSEEEKMSFRPYRPSYDEGRSAA